MASVGGAATTRSQLAIRDTVFVVIAEARTNLLRLTLAFLAGFLVAFYWLWTVGWDFLKEVTESGMTPAIRQQVQFIAQTPFDVVLLQVKIGIIVGLAVALPLFLLQFLPRLRDLNLWPAVSLTRWQVAGIAVLSTALFVLGVSYAYELLFPFLFEFFASNAVTAGFAPHYSIVDWAEFLLVLTAVFGVAAELPLLMSVLAYTEIVPYDVFRQRWRHAVVAITIVASIVNGSPDPLSMAIVALPLVVLYGLGLVIAGFVVSSRHLSQRTAQTTPFGDPTALDVGALDTAGIEAAPREAFEHLSEEAVLSIANDALDEGDDTKARALLDRYDEIPFDSESTVGDAAPSDRTRAVETGRAENDPTRDVTALGRDPDEELGGYYYDIAFVLDTLRSKSIRIVGVFIVVMATVFSWLSYGGIGSVQRDFLRRLPPQIHPEELSVITLHPAEALVFEMKFSLVVATAVTLPMVVYYSWPALRARKNLEMRSGTFLIWCVALTVGLVGGSVLGYAIVAPSVISYLVADTISNGIIVSYRISAFFWLIFYTTVGVGLLADVPVMMVLLNRAGVPFRTMASRWREVTVGLFFIGAVVVPGGVVMMFVFTLPILFAYGIGLLVLAIMTANGRRDLSTRPAFVRNHRRL
ncbi:twin-arginine translocase subunit TatC [Halomarina rubra]|uniref:Sec-independent protein translocase protein TatC n=1 Tax=Halomarina rubra TaxID=2071873 RepID=A0ABD6AX37_9EURY|nr:twin-arginine translocase subunit TatC [Halomarina rubra]